MTAILFALISYVGWGSGDIFTAQVSRKINNFSVTFLNYLLTIIILTILVPFLGDFSKLKLLPCLFTFILSIFVTGGFISFTEGFQKGNASLVGTIAGSFAALVVIFSMLFLGERITILEGLLIFVILSGIVLVSIDIKTISKTSLFSDKGIKYALVTLILWGIYFTFIKLPTQQIGWFWTTYFSYFTIPFIYLYIKFSKTDIQLPKLKSFTSLKLLCSVILLVIADSSYYISAVKGNTAVIASIAGSYPTLFVLLSFIFLKDKITKQQIAGIVVTLCGIVALSFLSA